MKRTPRPENVKTGSYWFIKEGDLIVTNYVKGKGMKTNVLTAVRDSIVKNCASKNPIFEWYLKSFLSVSDYKHFAHMASLINTQSNILYAGDNEPYTMESLAKFLGLSVRKTRSLINRLIIKGLVSIETDSKPDSISEMIKVYPYPIAIEI